MWRFDRRISASLNTNNYNIIDYTIDSLCNRLSNCDRKPFCFHLSVFCHHGAQDVSFITWRERGKKKTVMLILRNLLPALFQLFKRLSWPSQISYMPEIKWVGREQKSGPRSSLSTAQKHNRPGQTEIWPDCNRTAQLKYGSHARQTAPSFAQFNCVKVCVAQCQQFKDTRCH